MCRLKYFLVLIAVSFLLTTCNNNDQDSTKQIEYLVFGHFYGECFGKDCIRIFKMNCCQIFEDTNDIYPDMVHQYTASYIELDPKELDSASFLIHRIPHVSVF